MHAARLGNPEALALMLFYPSAKKHSDVSKTTKDGWTALDFAVNARHVICCQLLVDEALASTENLKDPAMFNTLYHSLL